MPEDLTDEQREAVEKLAEALNGGDPRAELLRKAARLMARRGDQAKRSKPRSTRSAGSS